MHGAMWVSSYVILCIVVALLSMSMVGLAREIGQLRFSEAIERDEWPIPNIGPGTLLPSEFRKRDMPTSGFVLLAVSQTGLHQNVHALQTLCRSTGTPLAVIFCDNAAASAEALAPGNGVLAACVSLPYAAAQFGIAANTIMFINEWKVIDATKRLYTPLSLKERFYFVGPSFETVLKEREMVCE